MTLKFQVLTLVRERLDNVETRRPSRQREMDDRRPEGIVSGVEGFNQRARGAVRDEELQEAVNTFQDRAVAARNAVLEALPEAPELRERAYHIKRRTMANLDHYLEQMADEKIRALERSGADTLISCDSSCLMHLKGRLRRTGHDTRVYHLAQILDGGVQA